MKLKKLHVENYGGLCELDMTFDTGINEVFESNGYGKTTLASFIKAMFYGLAPYRANGKDFNDRRKYYPFSGGKFGGNIEFGFNGDDYRIERFFGKKSDVEDEMKVYKNAVLTDDLGAVPGLKVFGLDEESFLRTLFITSEITEISSTSGINGLLGDFASDSFGGDYETAISKLEAARKKYKAAKGNNDLISQTQAEITDLKTKIENIEKEGEALERFYSELKEAEENEKQLGKILKDASGKNVEIEKWKTYDKMRADAEEKLERLKSFSEKYRNGLPEKTEIERAEKLALYAETAKAKREAINFSEDKKLRLQAYTRTFANGVPQDSELSSAQKHIAETSALTSESERLKAEIAEYERNVNPKFSNADTGAVLNDLERAAEKLREKQALLSAKRNAAEAPAAKDKKGAGGLILTAISVAAIIAGVVMAVLTGGAIRYLGAAVGAAGVIGLIFGIAASSKAGAADKKLKDREAEIIALQAEAEKYADEMKEILVPLGFYSRNGVMFDYAKCKADIEDYLKTDREKREKLARLAEVGERLKTETEILRRFFAGYGMTIAESSFADALYKLKNMIGEYSRLAEERQSFAQNDKAFADKESSAKRELNAFFAKYDLLCDGNEKSLLKSLEADLSETERLKKDCAELTASAEKYRKKNELEVRPEGEATDIGDVSERYRACQRAIAIKRGEISAAESVYETLQDNKSRLEDAEERLAEYKERRAIISLAEDYIKAADAKLQQKYVAPVKDKFVEFSAPIEKALGEKVVMDKDFRIYFESGGEIRDDKHLSSGQRCILSLCFRLSLIENAFGGEKPFIIMDDPFVNLDKEHIEKTLEFLKSVSKDEQIIYFCCHESRSAKK